MRTIAGLLLVVVALGLAAADEHNHKVRRTMPLRPTAPASTALAADRMPWD